MTADGAVRHSRIWQRACTPAWGHPQTGKLRIRTRPATGRPWDVCGTEQASRANDFAVLSGRAPANGTNRGRLLNRSLIRGIRRRSSARLGLAPLPSSGTEIAMHVIPMILRPASSCFDRDTYLAPADQEFSIEVTNLAPAPMSATLLISPRSDPVFTPLSGKSGMWEASFDKAVFKLPTVLATKTKSVIVPGLPTGEYVLQISEVWTGFPSSATFLVTS